MRRRRLLSGSLPQVVRATKEVIMAAGGVGSAKLLMLSGIGRAEELRRLGIASVVDLPRIGEN